MFAYNIYLCYQVASIRPRAEEEEIPTTMHPGEGHNVFAECSFREIGLYTLPGTNMVTWRMAPSRTIFQYKQVVNSTSMLVPGRVLEKRTTLWCTSAVPSLIRLGLLVPTLSLAYFAISKSPARRSVKKTTCAAGLVPKVRGSGPEKQNCSEKNPSATGHGRASQATSNGLQPTRNGDPGPEHSKSM